MIPRVHESFIRLRCCVSSHEIFCIEMTFMYIRFNNNNNNKKKLLWDNISRPDPSASLTNSTIFRLLFCFGLFCVCFSLVFLYCCLITVVYCSGLLVLAATHADFFHRCLLFYCIVLLSILCKEATLTPWDQLGQECRPWHQKGKKKSWEQQSDPATLLPVCFAL